MNANMKALMERFYKVPEQTANEVKLYKLANALRHGMTEPQAVTLDALLETCVDCIGDAAEDGFEQGLNAGLELAYEGSSGREKEGSNSIRIH